MSSSSPLLSISTNFSLSAVWLLFPTRHSRRIDSVLPQRKWPTLHQRSLQSIQRLKANKLVRLNAISKVSFYKHSSSKERHFKFCTEFSIEISNRSKQRAGPSSQKRPPLMEFLCLLVIPPSLHRNISISYRNRDFSRFTDRSPWVIPCGVIRINPNQHY